MPILPGGAYTRHNRVLEETPASLSEALGATAEETWARSITPSIDRFNETLTAETGREIYRGPLSLNLPVPSPIKSFEPNKVTQEEASRQLQDLNLSSHLSIGAEGTTQEKLDYLVKLKKEELHRQSILMRHPGSTATKLATGLGVSLLDPANIALSFVPVVGPARYAAMLRGATSAIGRAGIRGAVGAVEGTAGALIAEPIVYSQAQVEQADYDMMDSLLNIAFGTVLGGGLHMGGGAIADALAKGKPWYKAEPQGDAAVRMDNVPPEGRETVGRTAAAQMYADKNIDVENLIKAYEDEVNIARMPVDAIRQDVIKEFREELVGQVKGALDKGLPLGERKKLAQELKEIDYTLDNIEAGITKRAEELQAADPKLTGRKAKNLAKKELEAESVKLQKKKEGITKKLAEAELSKTAKKNIDDFDAGRYEEEVKARIEAEVNSRQQASGLNPIADAIRRTRTNRKSIDAELQNSVSKATKPGLSNLANEKGATKIAEDVINAKDVTLKEAEELLAAEQERLTDIENVMEDDVKELFKGADDLIEQTSQALSESANKAKALKALVSCQLRRGA